MQILQRLAAAGTNIVVLADEFSRGTTGAANRVLAPFGLRMKQVGRRFATTAQPIQVSCQVTAVAAKDSSTRLM